MTKQEKYIDVFDVVNDIGHWIFLDNCANSGRLYTAELVEPQENETWHGIHAQITAPKGTFERIFNEADDDNDI